MPSYTITDVSPETSPWKAQGKYDMIEYRVHLQEPRPSAPEILNVEWSRRAESPAPVKGQQIDVERLEDRGARGQKLHLAQQVNPSSGAYGTAQVGSDKYKADPAKQASIAMQHAQKAAIDILSLAAQSAEGYELPDTVAGIASQVRAVARTLYDQIVEVSGAAS